jgi:hypothetical protein
MLSYAICHGVRYWYQMGVGVVSLHFQISTVGSRSRT